jgi:hypothetical protein
MTGIITYAGIAALSIQLLAQQPARPQPTDAHKVLTDSAGTWDCKVKMFFRGPKGPPTESSGVETNEPLGDGYHLRTTFKYKMRDRQFEGQGLYGYDPRTKDYVGTWVDNFTAVPCQLKGKYDAEQKTLTLFGTVVDATGNEIKQKQVTKDIDKDTKTMEIYMIIDAAGKPREIKLMEMTAKRRS